MCVDVEQLISVCPPRCIMGRVVGCQAIVLEAGGVWR